MSAKRVYYYAVSIDGVEASLGTDNRGYIRRYASIRALRRYFLTPYIRSLYANCVKRMDMREYRVNVYSVGGLNGRLAYDHYTLVHSEVV